MEGFAAGKRQLEPSLPLGGRGCTDEGKFERWPALLLVDVASPGICSLVTDGVDSV